MTKTPRSDVHSPKSLVTEDYEYVYAIDNKTPWALHLGTEFLRELNDFDPALADRGTSQCHHCGAHIRYAAFLHHTPSGHTIVVGETCLDNRFDRATADFHRLRKAAELDRLAQRIKKAREAFVAANADLAWLNDEDAFNAQPEYVTGNYFIADIGRKLRHYGDLSEKQIAAVRKAVAREAAKATEKAAEQAALVRIPKEGRQVVTGRILATKWVDSQYGTTLKVLLLVHTEGWGDWKLWTTAPSAVNNPEKNDTLTIRVAVSRSKDDDTFGFGKRPHLLDHVRANPDPDANPWED